MSDILELIRAFIYFIAGVNLWNYVVKKKEKK